MMLFLMCRLFKKNAQLYKFAVYLIEQSAQLPGNSISQRGNSFVNNDLINMCKVAQKMSLKNLL